MQGCCYSSGGICKISTLIAISNGFTQNHSRGSLNLGRCWSFSATVSLTIYSEGDTGCYEPKNFAKYLKTETLKDRNKVQVERNIYETLIDLLRSCLSSSSSSLQIITEYREGTEAEFLQTWILYSLQIMENKLFEEDFGYLSRTLAIFWGRFSTSNDK